MPKSPRRPQELSDDQRRMLLDPYGEALLRIHRAGDVVSAAGSIVPLAGSALGRVAGSAYGLYRAAQDHSAAVDAYHARGGRLGFLERHPYIAGAVPTAALLPFGAAWAGPAIGRAVSQTARPDLSPVNTKDEEWLSKPYNELTRQTATGSIIGMGIGGTAGTLAGRAIGRKNHGLVNAGLTTAETGLRYFANKVFPRIATQGKPWNLSPKVVGLASGVLAGGTAAGLGSLTGSLPGLLSSMRTHSEVVDRAKNKGQKLAPLVQDPYTPYIAAGVVTPLFGLTGVKNLGMEEMVEYRRKKPVAPAAFEQDVKGFATHLSNKYFSTDKSEKRAQLVAGPFQTYLRHIEAEKSAGFLGDLANRAAEHMSHEITKGQHKLLAKEMVKIVDQFPHLKLNADEIANRYAHTLYYEAGTEAAHAAEQGFWRELQEAANKTPLDGWKKITVQKGKPLKVTESTTPTTTTNPQAGTPLAEADDADKKRSKIRALALPAAGALGLTGAGLIGAGAYYYANKDDKRVYSDEEKTAAYAAGFEFALAQLSRAGE